MVCLYVEVLWDLAEHVYRHVGLIHPHAVRYISNPYVRWCMLMYLEVSKNELLEKYLLRFQPWMEWHQLGVFIQICPPLNRTFLGWLTPSRMACNVLLFVQGREFQYQAQIFKCILSIETNIQGVAQSKSKIDTDQTNVSSTQCKYWAAPSLACITHWRRDTQLAPSD